MNNLQPIIDGITRTPLIIAGPCSAETAEQSLKTAQQLSKLGIRIFRAGLWKPRTHPGGFEGVGAQGLTWLKQIKSLTGMRVAVEIATPAHMRMAIDADINILWIGARTTSNPFTVQAIADEIERLPDKSAVTILVKNPLSPDIELWIGALQRIYNAGIRRLAAVHRGFTTYHPHTYRNDPMWHIPMELRLRYPNLPIITDPSHIAGKRMLVHEVAQRAISIGFDGLMVESHYNPDQALSDALQQITPQQLNTILKRLPRYISTTASIEAVATLREEVDDIDYKLLSLLSQRMQLTRRIGRLKKNSNQPVLQPSRYRDVLRTRQSNGATLGLSDEFVRKVFLEIHDESVRQQLDESTH